ncbi:MAG: 6-phosphofructokinase [Candidatus Rokubacteria bacterium RIFCSPHIGHO2_12_FULL_73_22]|nr:MAG: 6-phosphofructokinase [Candidatus Rokubacteria bacterium RIFCSPHIGHO2_02_FULL_73_26]OGL00837.1 MAG: 6-phosphofructokinase [Candidatus Rokubacteria bacterium RIFCSPHIGHO2_12_FULL_73_22]
MKTLAILVGGGPAPGINAVIAAATIEARNHGCRVLGCYDGFKWLVEGDGEHVVELTIDDLSRIHFDGGSIIRTSRTNPARSPEGVARVAETLKRLGVEHLITIGGDDTAYASSRVARAMPGLTVAHVPKTIDNDLPLPGDIVTFGYTTACNLGKELVRNLMQDASTTERWFFVTVMGRRAGHLALGIGGSAGATLTVIAEEFAEPKVSLDRVADVLEGAIIKRRMQGREHGVAILSEGLAEKLELDPLAPVERDQYGNVRLGELDLGRVLKDRVAARLRARQVDVTIVAKDLGYELRCAAPGAHDIQYCRSLGYWATRFLLDGGSNAMVTIQAGRLVPIPFGLMLDPKTGKVRVRYVDVDSEMYQTLWAYMIRLKPEDFDDPATRAALARAGNLDERELVERFGPLVGRPA